VKVGVGVLVAVAVGVAVFVGVAVGSGVAVAPGNGVAVGVAVNSGVFVGVGVAVMVGGTTISRGVMRWVIVSPAASVRLTTISVSGLVPPKRLSARMVTLAKRVVPSTPGPESTLKRTRPAA
jgi:hypothetical protein